jgi:hypothetical protein
VLDDLDPRLRAPGGTHPIEVVEQHWPAEPFTRGGPVAVSSPGAPDRVRPALRDPVGPAALGRDRDGHRSGAATSTAPLLRASGPPTRSSPR